MKKILLAVVLAASGCYGAVVAETPDLVVAAPGVRVIADYDEPIFFVDGFYWWFYSGVWYRSATYTGGWVYVTTPPRALVRINPVAYRHYRPPHYVPHRRPAPAHTIRRPVVRDHRARR